MIIPSPSEHDCIIFALLQRELSAHPSGTRTTSCHTYRLSLFNFIETRPENYGIRHLQCAICNPSHLHSVVQGTACTAVLTLTHTKVGLRHPTLVTILQFSHHHYILPQLGITHHRIVASYVVPDCVHWNYHRICSVARIGLY